MLGRRYPTTPVPRRTFRAGGVTFTRLLAPSVHHSPVYEATVNGRTWRVERFKPPPPRQWRAVTADRQIEATTLDELAQSMRDV